MLSPPRERPATLPGAPRTAGAAPRLWGRGAWQQPKVPAAGRHPALLLHQCGCETLITRQGLQHLIVNNWVAKTCTQAHDAT